MAWGFQNKFVVQVERVKTWKFFEKHYYLLLTQDTNRIVLGLLRTLELAFAYLTKLNNHTKICLSDASKVGIPEVKI